MISTHLFCVNGNPPCYINLFVLFFRHSGILRMFFLCEENLQYRQSRLTLFHHRQTFCGTEKKYSHEKFSLLREHKFGLIVTFSYWYLFEVIFSTQCIKNAAERSPPLCGSDRQNEMSNCSPFLGSCISRRHLRVELLKNEGVRKFGLCWCCRTYCWLVTSLWWRYCC